MAKRQKRKSKKIEVFRTGLKRVSAGFLTLFLILLQVQTFEAWEAHVINVTATIVQPCEQGFWIDGYKFYDRNGDSDRDGGEEGLPGWIIELKKLFDRRYDYNDDGLNDNNDIAILQDVADDLIECPNGKVCDLNGDGWVDDLDVGLYPSYPKDFGNYLTNESGYYEFKTLEPGRYRINEALQTGWLPTTPTNGELTFDLVCGENKVDFGNIHDSGPRCGDGIPDPGEECDDGNLINGDGCSSQCTNETGCILELLKVDLPDPVIPGGQLTYNLQLTNIGTENCTGSGVELKEYYDANTNFIAAIPQPTTGNDSWNFGDLAPNDSRQITITMQVSDLVDEGDTLTNQACFWAAQYPDWVCINQETQVLAPTEEQNIVINEFLPNPPGSDNAPMPNGEWVELYNRGATDIDVADWVLYDDNNNHELFVTSTNTTSSSTIVPAGGFLVVFRNGDTDFQLNNTGGDSVRLYTDEISQGGILIDSYTYTINAGVNKSFARIPDGSENWVDPYPTPGEDNRLPTEDDPPVDLSNEPPEEPEIEDNIPGQKDLPITIFGCADQNNIFINQDNGSCNYLILGCNDPLALNYNPAANQNDNSCIYPILDCTNAETMNYPADTIENNSCFYSEPERQDDPGLEPDPELQPEPGPDSNYDSNPE